MPVGARRRKELTCNGADGSAMTSRDRCARRARKVDITSLVTHSSPRKARDAFELVANPRRVLKASIDLF